MTAQIVDAKSPWERVEIEVRLNHKHDFEMQRGRM